MSMKQGMKYFIDAGLVTDTHEDRARFLRFTPGLDKTKIGEYLGGRYVTQIWQKQVDV